MSDPSTLPANHQEADAIPGAPDPRTDARPDPSRLFRAQALAQLDVSAELDNQLPLVPRRAWLLLVGAGAIVIAFLAWCAFTPSVEYVKAEGRVLGPPGLLQVAATSQGTVQEVLVEPGDSISSGTAIVLLATDTGTLSARALAEGTVWQLAAQPGDPITVGQQLTTLLPPGSGGHLTLAIPETEAADVRVGMKVVGSLSKPIGRVESVRAPLQPDVAQELAALDLEREPGANVVLVYVRLDQPMTAGSLVQASVVTSSSTILRRMLGD